MSTYSLDDLFTMSKSKNVPQSVLDNLGAYGATNLVSYDESKDKTNPLTFAVKLLNWVEPYYYNGYTKSLFYTEVSSNVKVGDKVFIINGVYDSNERIKTNKYQKGSDGYKVLYVDNCKVALDLDYTGIKPFKDDDYDDYVKVFVVNDQEEFDYVNREITTKNGFFDFKYNKNNDYCIYINDFSYNSTPNGIGMNMGINSGPGFYIKDNFNTWTNITTDFISGSFSITQATASNDKIRVVNGDINYNNTLIMKNGFVYKYESNWIIDNSNLKELAILTKSNFRDGLFKGEFNSGVYGTQDKKIVWDYNSNNSTWNNGTLFHSVWKSGLMNSKFELDNSYIADFDRYDKPFQKINSLNNSGFGFNYVINSEFELGTMSGANLNNSTIGDSTLTYSIIENDTMGYSTTYSSHLEGVTLQNVNIVNATINKSLINNSRINNSMITNSKSINSQIKGSVFRNSSWNSEGIIKILDYSTQDISVEYVPGSTYSIIQNPSHKVFKFYISRTQYQRLKVGDFFYIKGLKVEDGKNEILNFFDRKFKIGYWLEIEDVLINDDVKKVRSEFNVFLTTQEDNSYNITYNSDINGYYTTLDGVNDKGTYALDIWIRTDNDEFLSEYDLDNMTLNIDLAYIVDSYIDGLVDKSDWNSGNDINYSHDTNLNNYNTNASTYSLYLNTNNNLILEKDILINKESKLKVNDVIFMDIDDFDGSTYTKLPDTYKVININVDNYELMPLTSSTVQVNELLNRGSHNRYGYMSKLKINKSKIKSGIFKRSLIKNSLIQDNDYDSTDKDYLNMDKIKNLVVYDTIFSDRGNILSAGTYLKSSMVGGTDKWFNGISENCIWDGMTLTNGVVKNSSWLGGTISGGIFYNNRSFDATPTSDYPYYFNNNLKNWWRNGLISSTEYNDRYSFQYGYVDGGEIYKSDFESGEFNNGKFYLSKWYSGNFNFGQFGDDKINVYDTIFYSGDFNDGLVVNSYFYSYDTSLNFMMGAQDIQFNDGIFQSGIFGCDFDNGSTATWNNGIFNSGDFIGHTKWKNGVFNGGNFLSYYGIYGSEYNSYTKSTIATEYSWENGVFTGGEFGTLNGVTNSTWFNGEFTGGEFRGRKWNNGIFMYGDFFGSVTYSPISEPDKIMESYLTEYYGLWVDGYVTENKDYYIKDKKVESNLKRSKDLEIKGRVANLNDILWLDGKFSHNSATINNSAWLKGIFEKGTFKSSTFNPYVIRPNDNTESFERNLITPLNCKWENGILIDSTFHISEWDNGNFISGTAYGMIYKNGITDYMNAYNIYWMNGIWRNGNWNGSYIKYNDNNLTTAFEKELIDNINHYKNDSNEIHIWNIFEGSSLSYDPETYLPETILEDDMEVTQFLPNPVVNCSQLNVEYNKIEVVGKVNTDGTIQGSGYILSTTNQGVLASSATLPTGVGIQTFDLNSTLTNVNLPAHEFTGLSPQTAYYIYTYTLYNDVYYFSSVCGKMTSEESLKVYIAGEFRDLYKQDGNYFGDDYEFNQQSSQSTPSLGQLYDFKTLVPDSSINSTQPDFYNKFSCVNMNIYKSNVGADGTMELNHVNNNILLGFTNDEINDLFATVTPLNPNEI